MAHNHVIAGRQHRNAAVGTVKVEVFDDQVAPRQFDPRLYLRRLGAVERTHEHRLMRRPFGMDRDTPAGVRPTRNEHRRAGRQGLGQSAARFCRCALWVGVVGRCGQGIVHVVEGRVRRGPWVGRLRSAFLNPKLGLWDGKRPVRQRR